MGQGKENARQYLVQNPDLTNKLELEIRKRSVEQPLPIANEKISEKSSAASAEAVPIEDVG